MNEQLDRKYTYLPTITGLFVATLLVSNVLNSKIIRVGALPMAGGLLLFPLAYLFSDLLTEVYGYAESRKVIWTGFASLLLFVVMIEFCGALPADPSWSHQGTYQVILGRVPRLVGASMGAYFMGDFANCDTLAKCKMRTGGKRMSVRFVLSTVIGEFVDTVVFVVVAFAGVLPAQEIAAIGGSAWVLKVLWELLALPLTIPVVKAIKKLEQVDYFDTETDFSPFRF